MLPPDAWRLCARRSIPAAERHRARHVIQDRAVRPFVTMAGVDQRLQGRAHRLQLVAEGYTIVPDAIENNSPWALSEMEFDAKRRLGIAPQFGCFRAYWLDD